MRRLLRAAVCGLACLALLSAPLRAALIPPQPVAQRVATSDAVIVGKVTGFADKTVSATQFPGAADKTEYQVALVKVEDGICGAKEAKEVKVGFVTTPAPGLGQPIIRPGGARPVQLALGEEYLLFLKKHRDGDFYTIPFYFSAIDKKNDQFAPTVEEAKKCAKLLTDPKSGLESKKEENRFLTAAMLIFRYRGGRFNAGDLKQEPIEADESKLILKALADANWAAPPAPGPGNFAMTPQNIFMQLGLTEADDWKQPMNFNDVPEAAKKWLKDHADSYRIKRFVSEDKKTEKKE